MAKAYRLVDRDQPMLLPVDLREWVPREHLVWFVISTVEKLDLARFGSADQRSWAGRARFDPQMLLTVLVYAYAMGQRSSRQIERLCRTDVSFMVACGRDAPDHTTIARFRKDHEDAIAGLFAQVLVLCSRSGLVRLGKVAIDGTKIAANASDGALRTEEWIRDKAAKIVAENGTMDAAEDAEFGPGRSGDELPAELIDPHSRDARILQVLADLDAEQAAAKEKAKAAADAKAEAYVAALTDPALTPAQRQAAGGLPTGVDLVAVAQARLNRATERAQAAWDRYQQRVAAAGGRRPPGRPSLPPEDSAQVRAARLYLDQALAAAQAPTPAPAPAPTVDSAPAPAPEESTSKKAKAKKKEKEQPVRRNITDPDSRLMATRKGWIVGFNAQLAVSEDQIILVANAVQNPVDNPTFTDTLTALSKATDLLTSCGHEGTVGIVLADAGYRSIENVTAPGPDRLIATGRRRDEERRALDEPAEGPPPEGASALEAMAHRVRTPEGHDAYRRRSVIVEPVNGHLKDIIGLRRFSRRGLKAINSELALAATVCNMLKMFRHQALAA